ncbi:hypothetical protein ACVG8J_002458, partial [Providencia stuartii]
RLSLLKDGDNLAIGKTCFFHRDLLSSDYKKILLINTPIFRGDYPIDAIKLITSKVVCILIMGSI